MTLKTILITILCFSSLVLGVFVYKQVQTSHAASLIKKGVFLMETPREIASFNLLDQTGSAFTEKSFKGKWHWVFFGFTHCPDICPATLATLKQAMKKLNKPLQDTTDIVLISVDPARDTVDTMKQYVGFFGPNITGVTGDFMALLTLTNSLGVPFKKVTFEDDDYTVDHSGYVYLINPDGQYQAFFKPPFDTQRFADTYTELRAFLKRD